VHLSAVEHKDSIVFLHAVQAGPASQSYGLQVAQLAGVPQGVIKAARKHLARLESQALDTTPQLDLFAAALRRAGRGGARAGTHGAGGALPPRWPRSTRTRSPARGARAAVPAQAPGRAMMPARCARCLAACWRRHACASAAARPSARRPPLRVIGHSFTTAAASAG
jgi:hypothetical protein